MFDYVSLYKYYFMQKKQNKLPFSAASTSAFVTEEAVAEVLTLD